MISLKPRWFRRRPTTGFDQTIHAFPKDGIGQHVLDLVARYGLQYDPWVMRDLPQSGIKLPPHFVGGMIPGPVHVQGEFRQRIEPRNFHREEIVDGVSDTGKLAHDLLQLQPSIANVRS